MHTIPSEPQSNDSAMAMPSINRSRDQGELQDMYRRSLAASWAANPGELPADQCIEDIFNGGDGWKDSKHNSTPRVGLNLNAHFEDHDNQRRFHRRTPSGGSDKSSRSQSTVTTKRSALSKGHRHKHKDSVETMNISPLSEESLDRGRVGVRKVHEVAEFDQREDLIAWTIAH